LKNRAKFTEKSGSPSLVGMDGESALVDIDLNQGTTLPGEGQIQALKPQGDKVQIVFKKLNWVAQLWNCQDSNVIDRVDFASGKVYYKQNCKRPEPRSAAARKRRSSYPRNTRPV